MYRSLASSFALICALLAIILALPSLASAVTVARDGNTIDVFGTNDTNNISVALDTASPQFVLISSRLESDPVNIANDSLDACDLLADGIARCSISTVSLVEINTAGGADIVNDNSFAGLISHWRNSNLDIKIKGALGNDLLYCPQATANDTCTLSGEDGDDNLQVGISGRATLNGGNGDDLMYGSPTSRVQEVGDVMRGDAGDDHFIGSPGADTMYGDAGVDSYSSGPGDDRIVTGDGIAETNIFCGEGYDLLPSYDQGLDIPALDCEVPENDQCPNLTDYQYAPPAGYFRNAAGMCVVDRCPNLTGNQEEAPAGYGVNASGSCVADKCTNMVGLQENIPTGYFTLSPGTCVQDQCPNISGGQLTVPYDHILDAQNNCIVDVCPNINGAQASVPTGYIRDYDYNCYADKCPNMTDLQKEVPSGMFLVNGKCELDQCLNVDGIQVTFPSDMFRVGRDCYVDQCPNLNGGQIAVPDGYKINYKIAGEPCMTDTCPNVSGHQFDVPPGFFKESTGKCAPDDCANLAGAQAKLPLGYAHSGRGDYICVVDACSNIDKPQPKIPSEYWRDAKYGCYKVARLIVTITQSSDLNPNAGGSYCKTACTYKAGTTLRFNTSIDRVGKPINLDPLVGKKSTLYVQHLVKGQWKAYKSFQFVTKTWYGGTINVKLPSGNYRIRSVVPKTIANTEDTSPWTYTKIK